MKKIISFLILIFTFIGFISLNQKAFAEIECGNFGEFCCPDQQGNLYCHNDLICDTLSQKCIRCLEDGRECSMIPDAGNWCGYCCNGYYTDPDSDTRRSDVYWCGEDPEEIGCWCQDSNCSVGCIWSESRPDPDPLPWHFCKYEDCKDLDDIPYTGKMCCSGELCDFDCQNCEPCPEGTMCRGNEGFASCQATGRIRNSSYSYNPFSLCPDDHINTAIGCIPISDGNAFVEWLFPKLLGVMGGIAFLLMLYGGFLVLTSSGNPEKIKAGQETITAAITGLLFAIFSLFILQLIGVEILQIPGLG